jgi:hypothetical protein
MADGLPVLAFHLLLATAVVASASIANAAHGLVMEPWEGGIPWAVTDDLNLLPLLAPAAEPIPDLPPVEPWEGCRDGVPEQYLF